ncbi:ArsR/SmtB family transcription factor [Allostreptomyces psammosilenae]|uniref:DNA-binding transcriptional ArsR family regulator n=1 Tax=Allostreptomyces psammosilenae TaxID=1892865 RepID=A0A853AA95_9ACTN|nr:metalloregulator ArsR/SmtB family transcription factor [Allostreptomyces psammosilenae]NYI07551.1 DNA-binding transcriptional ArsR family regulator [Allostreptomyces psammosilenae]
MITIRFDAEDMADLRFAVSPLHETAASLWALAAPERFPAHLRWSRAVRANPGPVDVPLLLSLVGRRRHLPDFLTPTPLSNRDVFEDELDRLARVPERRVLQDLRAVHDTGLPERLRRALDAGPDVFLARLVEQLAAHHRRHLAPHWPRIRDVLEADVRHRGERLVAGGARALFASIHPAVRWEGAALLIDKPSLGEMERRVCGRGCCLMPTLFARSVHFPVDDDQSPLICYPARGLGAVWAAPVPEPSVELGRLLGRPRARLLAALAEGPASTTELSRRLGVTPGAVSQHLAVLRSAGLVEGRRSGRSVLYRPLRLGRLLLQAHAAPAASGEADRPAPVSAGRRRTPGPTLG